MKEGDIIVCYMAQSDRTFKKRPALVLKEMPAYSDFLICGISSNLSQYIDKFDELILQKSGYFSDTGLATDSIIRLSQLIVVPKHYILGTIGSIPKFVHKKLLLNLSNYLAIEK